eukprot:gene19059-20973_t
MENKNAFVQHEEVESLRQKIREVTYHLIEMKEGKEDAITSNEKLTDINKELVDEIEKLKKLNSNDENNFKLMVMQKKLEQQRELADIMFNKYVSGEREGIVEETLKRIILGDESESESEAKEAFKFKPDKKDSGVCMESSKFDLESGRDEDTKESSLKTKIESLEQDKKDLQEKADMLEKENALLKQNEVAMKIAKDSMMKGLAKQSMENEKKMTAEMAEVRRELVVSKEGNRMLQMHSIKMNEKLKQVKAEYQNAMRELKIVKKELDKVKNMYAENEELKQAEFDKIMIEAKKREDGLRHGIRELEDDFNFQKGILKRHVDACIANGKRIIELEEEIRHANKEKDEERKWREEESAAKEEYAKEIAKQVAEKEKLVILNRKLIMKRNILRMKYDKQVELINKQQEMLQKTQEYARELEEEDYHRRVTKSSKKGWKKLRLRN